MVDEIVGQNLEGESFSDDNLDRDHLRETIGYTIFTATIARFMPMNCAIMFEREMLLEMLNDLEYDYRGLEDNIEDLVLVHIYEEDTDSLSVFALTLDSFFESMSISGPIARSHTEAILRSGKVVNFKFEQPDQDDDDDEGE